MKEVGLAALAILAACSGTSRSGTARVLQADTLISAGDERLGQVFDLTLGPNGMLYITDAGLHRISVFDPDGKLVRTFGRQGNGPGEFEMARSIEVSADSVRFVDPARSTVEVYDTAGSYGRTIRGIPGVSITGVAFDRRGQMLQPHQGFDSAFAHRLAPDGTRGGALGTLLVPPRQGMDFSAIKTDLVAGRPPASLRNFATPVLADDGSAWMLMLVDGTVQHYSPTDSLEWSATLPDSTLARLRADIYRRARADTLPNSFPFPTVFHLGREFGSGLLILLRAPTDSVADLIELDSAGHWGARWHVNGATNVKSFALDTTTKTLYLLDGSEGAVLRAHLP